MNGYDHIGKPDARYPDWKITVITLGVRLPPNTLQSNDPRSLLRTLLFVFLQQN